MPSEGTFAVEVIQEGDIGGGSRHDGVSFGNAPSIRAATVTERSSETRS